MLLDDLRRATPDDATGLLELVTASDTAELGEADVELADIVDGFTHASQRSWVLDGDGGPSAYLWVDHLDGSPTVHSDVLVHPQRGEAAWFPDLVAAARRHAAEVSTTLPHKMFVATGDGAAAKRAAVEAAGGEVVRHFWRLRLALGDTAPEVPVLPDGVAIDKPGEGDDALRAMYDVLNTAFLDHYDGTDLTFEQWREEVSGPWADRSVWWLARRDGKPVAALLGRDWGEAGYIGELGTLREARGTGLARALLLTSFAEFHGRGKRYVDLSVDAASPTNAVALYTSVGMTQRFGWDVYQLPAP